MASQSDILELLAKAPRAKPDMTIAEIASALRVGAGRTVHRQLANLLGKLVERGFAERLHVDGGDKVTTAKGGVRCVNVAGAALSSYFVTAEGRSFVGIGSASKSGPRKKRAAPFRTSKETLRARAWRVMRAKKKGSVREIVGLAKRPIDNFEKACANVQKFFWQLQAVGVIAPLAFRQKNEKRGSAGYVRYALVDDLGPLTPLAGRKHVFNPNADDPALQRLRYAETVRSAP